MAYILPLCDRIRLAAKQRDQYWRDEAFRLRRINHSRQQLGRPVVESLADISETPPRDSKGRFIKCATQTDC